MQTPKHDNFRNNILYRYDKEAENALSDFYFQLSHPYLVHLEVSSILFVKL